MASRNMRCSRQWDTHGMIPDRSSPADVGHKEGRVFRCLKVGADFGHKEGGVFRCLQAGCMHS
jgi:hypothetical protein